MLTYQTSTIISASQGDVWRVLSRVADWPYWMPTVSDAKALDGPTMEVGARYILKQSRTPPRVWIVTAHQEERRFTWESRFPGGRMIAEHVVSELMPGTWGVTLSLSFRGWLGVLLGRLYRSRSQCYLWQGASSLKERVEARLTIQHYSLDLSQYPLPGVAGQPPQ